MGRDVRIPCYLHPISRHPPAPWVTQAEKLIDGKPALDLKIFHIASLARAGETILLRSLSVHPEAHVVHDLTGPGETEHNSESQQLFQYLSTYGQKTISLEKLHELGFFRHIKLGASVLLLKQGVFFSDACPGIALLRDPWDAFQSLYTYDGGTNDFENNQLWLRYRLPRLIAWTEMMNFPAELIDAIKSANDPFEQYLIFYRTRARQLTSSYSSIFYYEDLIANPQQTLTEIQLALELEPCTKVFHSHQFFPDNLPGHGGANLSRKLEPQNTRQLLSPDDTQARRLLELVTEVGLDRYASRY